MNKKLEDQNRELKDETSRTRERQGKTQDSYDLNDRAATPEIQRPFTASSRPTTGHQKSPEGRRRRFEEQ